MLSVAATIAQAHHLLPAKCQSLNVRFGSKADIGEAAIDVRFTSESGHWNSAAKCRAFCQKRTIYTFLVKANSRLHQCRDVRRDRLSQTLEGIAAFEH